MRLQETHHDLDGLASLVSRRNTNELRVFDQTHQFLVSGHQSMHLVLARRDRPNYVKVRVVGIGCSDVG